MGRSVGHDATVTHEGSLRRSALVLLTFVYLIVGIGHNFFCTDQVIASGFTIENVLNGSDDIDTKTAFSICDHCPICTPALMPEPTLVSNPSHFPIRAVVARDVLRIMDHSRLDTPPPKHLT